MQQCEIFELDGFDGSDQSGGKRSEESDENLFESEVIDFS
jgi:hypothetical protein